MNKIVKSIAPLLLAISLLLSGNGLLGTLTGMRASYEGFHEILTGLIMAAYFLGFVVGIYLCPALLKSVGYIRTFTVLVALCAVAIILQGYFVTIYSWILLRLLVGICLVGVYVVIESWLNNLTSNENRGKTLCVYQMTTLLALAAGQFLILMADVNTHTLFVLSAALFVISIVPVALTKLDEPEIVNGAESLDLRELYQISRVSILSSLTSGLVNGSFFALAAVSAIQLGLDKKEIAILMSAMILGGAILQWPIGHLSDRFDRRNIIALASLFGSIFSVLMLFFFHYYKDGIIVIVFLYGGMSFVLYPIGSALLNDIIPREKFVLAARGMSLTYGIGAAIGPICVGLLMTMTGPEAQYVFSAIILFILALFGYFEVHNNDLPITEHEAFIPMVRTSPVALELHP